MTGCMPGRLPGAQVADLQRGKVGQAGRMAKMICAELGELAEMVCVERNRAVGEPPLVQHPSAPVGDNGCQVWRIRRQR